MTTAFSKADASDYITAKRQTAIYKEYAKAGTPAEFNPQKTNGKYYNKNFGFIPLSAVSVDISNCLIRANSYEALTNYQSGQIVVNQSCAPDVYDASNSCCCGL